MQNRNGGSRITSVVMKTMIDFAEARTFAIPMTTRFRGIDVREGMLIEGPAGWGEFAAFPEYDDAEAASWLTAAIEACTVGWPDPVRGRVPVNATVPAVGPARAHEIAASSGWRTV
jgi:O-succinylbenzoate synthase